MRLPLLAILLLPCAALAQSVPPPPALEPVPDGAPPPPPRTEEFEPQVTIIRRREVTIEEYRVNGLLYMVRVVPAVGPAYYLVDTDGDGELESRHDDNFDRVQAIPAWVIFSW
jgi:hypothetical protein